MDEDSKNLPFRFSLEFPLEQTLICLSMECKSQPPLQARVHT
uniref:Uncharacterized protein n=1 Tax=Rhizophora mucronata TaxID=61149 RepID=A0A2P2PLR2_RHIMU